MTNTFNDSYELKSLIGQGGMSKVYLAEHKRLHTSWAVKEVFKQPGAQFDFMAESNLLKRLQHPMLPRIIDIFEDEQAIYIVEDFVEGITLEQMLQSEGKVDEAMGLQWFKDLCGALSYLHNQKPHPIIYRDLKPSNIMLQPDGSLKLIDFGIAREYKQESSADTTYIGTKGYAAPEQFGSAQTDARTDIYSLGVTMYHLLTGKSPYEPPYQFVPARQLEPKLSRGTEHILNQCVHPEPESRYQDVAALLDDLEHIYRFDLAYQKYVRVKRTRVAVLAIMLITSISLMVGGRMVMTREAAVAAAAVERARAERYNTLLSEASRLYTADEQQAIVLLDEARALYPSRPESYRQTAYALYLNGDWQGCVDYGDTAMETVGADSDLLLTTASALFELEEYSRAAERFYQGAAGSELTADHLLNYAVCLGRMGDRAQAESVLEELIGKGGSPAAAEYVRGELAYAAGGFSTAETAFLAVLDATEEPALIRRCYLALSETYRDSALLPTSDTNAIVDPYTKIIHLLNQGLTLPILSGNPVFHEMLGSAYYNRGQTGDAAQAAEHFQRVLSLGVQKPYLYVNAFTAYQSAGDYRRAQEVLLAMAVAYPSDYTPHALMATLMIMQENQKPERQRSFQSAYVEYQTAQSMVTGSDDTTQLQQLEGLILQLKNGGWL